MDARLSPTAGSAESYKRRIQEALFPNPISRRFVSIDKARQAVREFRRASNDPVRTIDLTLFYVECGTDFVTEFGYEDERYFSSLESMFAVVLKDLGALTAAVREEFIERIGAVVELAGNTGWGYQDELRAQFEEWLETHEVE